MNFLVTGIAALIPVLTGFIWYSNLTFGKAWMKAAGVTEEKMKSSNMGAILLVTLIFSFMLAMMMNALVIHQNHVYSTVTGIEGFGQEGSAVMNDVNAFMEKYGREFRTFKHGVLHGVLAGLFLALPILGINALFERRGFKYIAIHTLYWMLTLGLMGGVICQWS